MATQQQPLFYKRVVPLSKERHKSLYIEPVAGFAYASKANSIYVAVAEFPRACRDYPIVFGRDGLGNLFPVVLLGLKSNQNLFVDKKGEWRADYIPAYARRYPFILSTTAGQGDKFTVCIDESYPGFNTAKEGQPLFDGRGKESKVLKQAVDFLRDYQTHVQLTAAFCKNLEKLAILESMQANISLKSGEKFSVGGFVCVSRNKLKGLQPKQFAELVKSDQMEMIYAHLQSLRNVESLSRKLT